VSIDQLKSHLKQKKLPPLMIIEGDEDHLVGEAHVEIKKIVTEEMEYFNLYGDQVVHEDFNNNLNTISFFGSSKVFVIKAAKSLPKESIESLLEIFKKKPVGLHVVLFFTKVDKRKKVFKELLSIAQVFELKPPYDNQMNRWAQTIAREKGLGLKTEHIELIRHLVGDTLTDIVEALDRLKVNYKKGEIFSDEKIQKVVSLNRRSNLFEICDLMGHADFTQASLEFDRAFSEGESLVAVIHLLLRHFDILMKLKNESPRASKYDLAKAIGVPAFFVPNYKEQSDLWRKEDLLKMQSLLEEFDILSKSTGLKPTSLSNALLIKSTAVFGQKSHLMNL